jgi:hypothetical protein
VPVPACVTLPANATYAVRTAEWNRVTAATPVTGVLTIRETNRPPARVRTGRYAVVETGADAVRSRAFRLTKPGGAEHYGVLITLVSANDLCECTGFLQYGNCKHLQALRALLNQRHI